MHISGVEFPDGYLSLWTSATLISSLTKHPIHILKWYRTCLIVNLKRKRVKWYCNNHKFEDKYKTELRIRQNGTLYVGQDQDSMNGGFAYDQSFSGYIGRFEFYDFEISDENARNYVKCPILYENQEHSRRFLDFNNISDQWILNGNVKVVTINTTDICNSKTSMFLSFFEKRTFNQMLHFCHALKSRIPLPTTVEENALLKKAAKLNFNVCEDSNGNGAWLAAVYNEEIEKFVSYYEGTEILYETATNLKMRENYFCTNLLVMGRMDGYWQAGRCDKDPICSVCEFKDIVYMKVKKKLH